MNIIKNAFQFAIVNKSMTKLSDEFVRDMYISSCSLIGSGNSQVFIEVLVLDHIFESFLGFIIDSFTEYKEVSSFCMNLRFIVFGLFKQDYTLLKEVIEKMGKETFDYQTFQYDIFEYESFSFDIFETDTFELDTLDITFLHKEVIDILKVCYVLYSEVILNGRE